jgi:hypothetical protein
MRYRGLGPAVVWLLTSWSAAAELSHLPRTEPTVVSDPLGYQIRIGSAVRIPVHFREVLPTICRTSSRQIVACTFFAAEKIECSCRPRGLQWKIEAEVEFVPVMYLYSGLKEEPVRHEEHHIEDVTAMLKRHLDEVVSRPYRSEQECRTAARAERARFPARMNGYRADSNRRLR